MKFSPEEKVKLVEELACEPKRVERLRELGIASSTYYGWKRRLAARGVAAFIAAEILVGENRQTGRPGRPITFSLAYCK